MKTTTIYVQVEDAGRTLPEVTVPTEGRYKGKPVVEVNLQVAEPGDVQVAGFDDEQAASIFNHGLDLKTRGRVRAKVSAKVRPLSPAKVVEQINNFIIDRVGDGWINPVLLGQIKHAKAEPVDETWLREFHQTFILEGEPLPDDDAWGVDKSNWPHAAKD